MQYKPNMKIYNISMMTTFAFSTVKQILNHFLQESRNVFCIYMIKKHATQYSLSQNVFPIQEII